MSSPETTLPAPVLVRRQGRLGRITLNRPEAVNALTGEMVTLVADALDRWEADSEISCVMIDGAGDRGLCAGEISARTEQIPPPFLRAEFRLNDRIARYPKPYLAWMDGITMGGGVGVSAHGSIRIVTERSRVAMPETRIALSPDVGGTYLLSRAPGRLGLHLALTSGTMTGADALLAGFADLLLPSGSREQLADAVAGGADPRAAADGLALTPDPSPLAAARDWIDACYSFDTLAEVIHELRETGGEALGAAQTISSFSPTASAVAFAAIRRAATLTLRECLSMEFSIMNELAVRDDVREGVRATLIDRSHTPHWTPDRLALVDLDEIDRLIRRKPLPPLW